MLVFLVFLVDVCISSSSEDSMTSSILELLGDTSERCREVGRALFVVVE